MINYVTCSSQHSWSTSSDFWLDKLNENFITNLILTDTHSNKVKERNWIRQKPRLLDMKFDRARFSIKSSTRFKWAITFDAKCFREKPSEKTRQLLAGKRTFSWDRKENNNSIYDNNDDDTCNSKKKNSHNIIMFSLMPNNNYLL